MNNEFLKIIRPIVKHSNYKKMKSIIHHKKTSAYKHSIKVAYLSYNFYKKHEPNIDLSCLIKGALLHDYYLYDWHIKEKFHKFHGYKHPKIAYNNAIKDFKDLSNLEKDIITHHMFPLTIMPPKSKEAWIVCWCDKLAAISDYIKG